MSKIVVVGDIILDIYVEGIVERISPEAPIPILKHEKTFFTLGGAANVARNLVALGNECYLATVSGEDPAKADLWNTILAADLDVQLFNSPNRITTIKTRYMSNGKQLLRVDSETSKPISDKQATNIADYVKFKMERKECDVLVISDYNKGVVTPCLASLLMGLGNEFGVDVVVDSKGKPIEMFSGATLITPNIHEMKELCGNSMSLALDYVDNLLITNGSNGMDLITHTYEYHVGAISKNAIDVSGAGDTVLAVMASEIAKNTDLTEAVNLANLAASIVVNKLGTSVCSHQELTHAVARGDLKHYEIDNLLDKVDEWVWQDKTIGFINGCFDMLHSGHLHLIREAKKHCDKLIIAVNSNNSVTKLKGPGRPINLERHKALAAIKEVDAVIQFDEDTPQRIIELITPSIHFVGSDYTEEQVRKVSCAGAIVQIPHLNPNFSTSEILK